MVATPQCYKVAIVGTSSASCLAPHAGSEAIWSTDALRAIAPEYLPAAVVVCALSEADMREKKGWPPIAASLSRTLAFRADIFQFSFRTRSAPYCVGWWPRPGSAGHPHRRLPYQTDSCL